MAKFNLIARNQNGVDGGSASDFFRQLKAAASQVMMKVGKTSYPLARITTRASSRAKVDSCGKEDGCIHQEQRVRIEITGLAAGKTEHKQELMKLLMLATSEAQALIKASPVIGYAPTDLSTDDAISSLTLNLTGAVGVGS